MEKELDQNSADKSQGAKGGRLNPPVGLWRPMRTAPRDGTSIKCLVYHRNRRYAKKSEKAEWTDVVTAQWTDYNGGGWVWRGMMGQFRGWMPNVGDLATTPAPSDTQKNH